MPHEIIHPGDIQHQHKKMFVNSTQLQLIDDKFDRLFEQIRAQDQAIQKLSNYGHVYEAAAETSPMKTHDQTTEK